MGKATRCDVVIGENHQSAFKSPSTRARVAGCKIIVSLLPYQDLTSHLPVIARPAPIQSATISQARSSDIGNAITFPLSSRRTQSLPVVRIVMLVVQPRAVEVVLTPRAPPVVELTLGDLVA